LCGTVCSSLAEQTRRNSEVVKELQAQVATIDAERTCIELELTNVKAERDNVARKLAAAQITCKELSDQWEKLQEAGDSVLRKDSLSEPQEVTQRLQIAENQVREVLPFAHQLYAASVKKCDKLTPLKLQVERLSSCLANEQIARDLVTKQLVAATKDKKSLEQKYRIQGEEVSRLRSDVAELKLRCTTSNRGKSGSICVRSLLYHHGATSTTTSAVL
jgi:chromosome segregation ATPase